MPCIISGVTYPDGTIEGTVYVPRGGPSEQSWWQEIDEEQRQEDNRQRSARNAATTMRRKIRSGDLRRLLTFTNGEAEGVGFRTLREGIRSFWAWYLHGGRRLLGDSGIVAVSERGSHGQRVHIHAAIRKGYRIDYNRIRDSWSAHLEAAGYHSKTGTHRFHSGDEHGKHKDGFDSARTCALYMAGYLRKSLLDESRVKSERRFESASCVVPEPRRFYGLTLGEAPGLLRDTFGHCSVTPFENQDGELCGFWFDSGAPPPR